MNIGLNSAHVWQGDVVWCQEVMELKERLLRYRHSRGHGPWTFETLKNFTRTESHIIKTQSVVGLLWKKMVFFSRVWGRKLRRLVAVGLTLIKLKSADLCEHISHILLMKPQCINIVFAALYRWCKELKISSLISVTQILTNKMSTLNKVHWVNCTTTFW